MQYLPPALERLVEQFARLPGIGRKTAPLAVEAGANVLVAGSAVYGAADPAAAIAALRGDR